MHAHLRECRSSLPLFPVPFFFRKFYPRYFLPAFVFIVVMRNNLIRRATRCICSALPSRAPSGRNTRIIHLFDDVRIPNSFSCLAEANIWSTPSHTHRNAMTWTNMSRFFRSIISAFCRPFALRRIIRPPGPAKKPLHKQRKLKRNFIQNHSFESVFVYSLFALQLMKSAKLRCIEEIIDEITESKCWNPISSGCEWWELRSLLRPISEFAPQFAPPLGSAVKKLLNAYWNRLLIKPYCANKTYSPKENP